MMGAFLQHEGRHLVGSLYAARIDPDFRTDVGFLQRVDQQIGSANVGYRWWPESWIINWGPSLRYQVSYTHAGIREDENVDVGLNMNLSRNVNVTANAIQAHERFGGVDFDRRNYDLSTFVSTSRLFSLGGSLRWGDEILLRRPREPVSRARQQRHAVRDHPARPAVHLAARPRHQPVLRRPRRPRPGGVQRARAAGALDVHVHRPPAAAEHHRVRLVPRNPRHEPPPDLPHQRPDRVLLRIRRPLPAGGRARRARSEVLLEPTAFRRTNRALFTKLRVLFRY